MRQHRQIMLPLALTAAVIVALIGCIPIPATRQFQPDNRARPESAIGKLGSDKPIVLGQTPFKDAFRDLSLRTNVSEVHGDFPLGTPMTYGPSVWQIFRWEISPDRNQFAIRYSIRRRWWVAPLCFQAGQTAETRWLTLDVDQNQIVQRATTSSTPPSFVNISRTEPHVVGPAAWFKVFDEQQRLELYQSGVFPPDELLQRAVDATQRTREHLREEAIKRKSRLTTKS